MRKIGFLDGRRRPAPHEPGGHVGGHPGEAPGTLKWLSIKLGMLNVDEHKQLLEKRKAIQETLVDTQVKPQRKAVVPTRAIVWALEQGAEGTPPENRVPELTKAVDRYIMAMARFNLACSARFNDVQHTSPQTVKSTSNTLELLAWQTKTTSAVAIKRNPVPLIAPLFSFSGARWWIRASSPAQEPQTGP